MIVPLFIGGIGMPEILLIVLVVLLLFGGKKIPELMKGLGLLQRMIPKKYVLV